MSPAKKPQPGALSLELAEILSERMGRKRLSKSAVAKAAGMSRTTASDILRGLQEGDLGQLDLLCDALDLTFWEVVKEAEGATESRRLKR